MKKVLLASLALVLGSACTKKTPERAATETPVEAPAATYDMATPTPDVAPAADVAPTNEVTPPTEEMPVTPDATNSVPSETTPAPTTMPSDTTPTPENSTPAPTDTTTP